MGKVKLPREVAKCIENWRQKGIGDFSILMNLKETISVTEIRPDELMEALVNGYEVDEKTYKGLQTCSIWKGQKKRESYNVKINELNTVISIYKDTNTKLYQKIHNIVQGEVEHAQ